MSQNLTGHLVFTYLDSGGRLIQRSRDCTMISCLTGINLLTEAMTAMASNEEERLLD